LDTSSPNDAISPLHSKATNVMPNKRLDLNQFNGMLKIILANLYQQEYISIALKQKTLGKLKR